MEKSLVSVIVPVYNVALYLESCIKSLVQQTYDNLEIILIDDGSKDESGSICDKWSTADKRIIVIHKDNQGLGEARNTGIKNASGKYICFFDGDDYFDVNTIESAVKQIENYSAEICIFGCKRVDNEGNVLKTVIPVARKQVYRNEEVMKLFLPNLISPDGVEIKDIWMSACFCLFDLEVVKRVCWLFSSEREIISEDVYSLLRLYKNISSVTVLSEAPYNYRINNSSLSNTYRDDRFEQIKNFYNCCHDYAVNNNYGEEIVERLKSPTVSFAIATLKQIVHCLLPLKMKVSKLKDIFNDDILQECVIHNENIRSSYMRKILFYMIEKKKYFLGYILLLVRK